MRRIFWKDDPTIQELEKEYERCVEQLKKTIGTEESIKAEWQMDKAFMKLCKAKGIDPWRARKYIGNND